jgi:hypothetical protein
MANRVNLDGTFATEEVSIDNAQGPTKSFEEILEIYKQRKEKRDKLKSKK